jgi:sugar phosphate isomerase/epimerase
MDRREFIRNTSLSLLSVSLGKGGGESLTVTKKGNKKILAGFHVWVYAAPLPDNDVSPILEQIFSDVAYAGFDGVETKHQPLRSAVYTRQIGELQDKYKIKLIGSSYSAQMWDRTKSNEISEDVDKILSNMASVGGKTFAISVGQVRGRLKTEEELDNQAFLLRKIISLAKGRGITVNLHNHTYEVENNMHDLRGTLKRIPDVGLGPDLNWLLRAGVDPISFLKEFRKQIVYLHLRDQLSNGRWPESLGEGNVNFREIGDALRDINFSGVATVELAHEQGFVLTRPLRESVKMSRDYMKKTMGI